MRFLVITAIAAMSFSCSRETKTAGVVVAGDPVAKPLDTSVPYAPVQLVAPSGPPEVLPGGYLKIGFDRLSTFPFVVHMYEPGAATPMAKEKRPNEEEQIPDYIWAFDGKKALVTGFMLALKTQGNLVTEFILQKDQFTCCYGGTPAVNDWMVVKMKSGGIKNMPDVPISFYGTLHVGAKFDGIGFITTIYEFDAERMAPAK